MSPAGDAARLARPLLRAVVTVLPRLAAEAADVLYAAVDDFVAAPGPARYLAAMRTLAALARAARPSVSDAALAERAFTRGLERVAALPFVDAELAAALAALPCDARAGRRLDALAALLDAHQELAARVRRIDAERRPLPRAEPARAPAPRRAAIKARRR